MRMSVLAVGLLVLGGCTTPEMPATTMAAGQSQSTTNQREAPTPPALRTPRQRSGTGWPNIGYRPYGN